MNNKPLFYILDIALILLLTTYTLLDTFVIPRKYQEIKNDDVISEVVNESYNTSNESYNTSNESYVINESSYVDENIQINLTTDRIYDTTIYLADVVINNPNYLKTAFASNTYGKNITDKTSNIANENNAILAINGDYYGARNQGYVIRNGQVYRNSYGDSDQQTLLIDYNGDFTVIDNETNIDDLNNIYQAFSFGPALLIDNQITVNQNTEVDKAMANNPRTVICQIDTLHYLFVVADGRTNKSKGLSLYEMASYLQNLGVDIAYNLDGGGSSTMVFNNNLINNPTTNGNKIKERSVSDIVYIGY